MRTLLHRLRVLGLGVAFCALCACCASCSRSPASSVDAGAHGDAIDVALEGETMGSTWHIKVRVSRENEPAARAMKRAIDELLERVNDQMSTYRANSEISRFNAHASQEPFAVSRELAVVVAKALEVGRVTGGAYDITLDPLINAWGFDRTGPREKPPTPEEIADARQHTGLHLLNVDVDGKTLTKIDPLVTINLSGIAAGWAVDELARLFEARGFHDFMIEVTGEVRAKGRNARGSPWRIGVKAPDIDSSENVVSVPLDNRALTTSGSYHNFFESKATGKRYHHILDPKTGAPAETDLVSVTVMSSDAITADAYDTPFLVLGEQRAREIVSATPGMAALFIHQDATTGALTTRTTDDFPSAAKSSR